MKRITSLLSTLSIKYSKLTILIALAAAVFSLIHAGTRLTFDTDQDNLISKRQGYLRDYKAFLKEFGDWEYIYVVIRVGQRSKVKGHGSRVADHVLAKNFSDELTKRLNKRPDLFEDVVEKIDIASLKKSLLLVAPKEDFEDFVAFASKNRAQVTAFLNIRSVADWYRFVATLFEQEISPDNEQKLEKYWPHLKDALYAPFDQAALQRLRQTDLLTLFSGHTMDPEGYLFSENGKLLFIRVLPRKDYTRMNIIGEPLAYLRAQIDELRRTYPGLEVGVTGRPVLQNDEATSTQADTRWAGTGAFLAVALLFFIFFREFKRVLFSLFALIIGIAWTTGFISVAFGAINLITIVFAIILIGLGIDYGIHFLIRYETESAPERLFKTTKTTGAAIILGALTSAIAFATAVFTDFLGLKQLGLIAGVGIMLCCLAQLTVLPALLSLFDKNGPKNRKIPSFSRLAWLTRWPRPTLILTAAVTLLCLPLAVTVGFSSNLLQMQDPGLESVRFEHIIQEDADIATWFLAYKTRDLEELKRIKDELEKLPTVKKTESILDVIPPDQHQRIKRIKNLLGDRSSLSESLAFRKSESQDLKIALTSLQKNLQKLAGEAFRSGLADEYGELKAVSSRLKDFLKTRARNGTPPYARGFLAFLRDSQTLLKDWLAARPLSEKDLPRDLLNLYKGTTGYYSLAIYPKKNIWDPNQQEAFINDVRTVIPDVTGNPVTSYESARSMVAGFLLMAVLSSVLVIVVLFAGFRSLTVALGLYANLVVTFVWLLAFMHLAGMNINLANFFALPVLIGSGIDHGVHLWHRFQENNSLKGLFSATMPAITVSCLTTMFGFGALAFVRHRGLASFGLIMAVGTFLILVSSVIVLPNVLKLLTRPSRE